MSMKVLIIEDEIPAARKLQRLLNETGPGIEVVEIIHSVEDSVNWLAENPQPELIFMDIQLEDGLCFEIFDKISLNVPVIFTTAFNQYAIEAFKVNSVDYLLKPIDIIDLKIALDKYKTIHKPIFPKEFEDLLQVIQPKTKERFLIRVGSHYKSIPINEINCLYIRERCNFIQTMHGKHYALEYSLDHAEKIIDPNIFFRINRNMIVNINAINDIIAYSSNRLKLVLDKWTDEEPILVSRERVTDFKKWMDR